MQTEPPSTLTPAGRRVLDVASDLFYREGIHAVGVEGIAVAAGVTKKTLYTCFGSKDRLVAAYLSERDRRWRAWMTDWVAKHAEAPRDRLLATFDALAEWIERENPRGCGFVNALAELPSPEHTGHAIVVDQKRWMLDYLTGLAAEAGASDPAGLGSSLLLLHEGATVVAAVADIPDAAQRARAAAAVLIPVS